MKSTSSDISADAIDAMFNDKDLKKVNKAKDVDNVLLSAVNFYGPDVTSEDVETFYSKVGEIIFVISLFIWFLVILVNRKTNRS